MNVHFRLLGDVEACVDGRRLDVGHARQRCVLVSLLVDVNRPVPADQLIDRVWADQPPNKARNALAAYVSRLRQLFAADDAARIVHGPGGYTLEAPAESVDLHAFRDLVKQARSANPIDATKLLNAALELWHGEPLAALDTPWANEVRNSLVAEHHMAILARNDAALEAGRHTELLGDLSSTLQAHPLDERVAGQLMLAQFRSGRQAEALRTYRDIRDRLVDELGVDPSPPLQMVHQQILEGDPGHAPASSPPVTTVAGRTHNELPRRTTRLVGRDDDISHVADLVRDETLVTLTGVGGVGKTRLALAAAGRIQEEFPDGALLCELAPLDDGGALGQALAATLRLEAPAGYGFDDAVIDYLRPLHMLLVMDNCEHVLPEAADLVDRIARTCLGVKVLATSREPLGIEGERVIPVAPLTEVHAAELFAERARACRPDFDPEREPIGAVAEICRRLDGVPLAIELAAARMRMMSSLDVARRLDRLRLLTGGTRGAHPRQQSVTATIDWSYRLLSKPEQELFARLSVFAGGFDLEAAHEVCADRDASEEDTLDLVTGLVDKSMIFVSDHATRYGMLETLRAYGRERLEDAGLRDEMVSRHTCYFTALLEHADAGLQGPDEQYWAERMTPDAATTYTAPDYDNLRIAFEHAAAAGDIEHAIRLCASLNQMHARIGCHSAAWVDQALAMADPGHPLFGKLVGVAARAAWAGAQFARANALARIAEGHPLDPSTPFSAYPADIPADVALDQGNASTALAHYHAELEKTFADSAIRGVWILYNITLCHAAMGSPTDGLTAARRAMELATSTANPTALAMAHCAAGRVLAMSAPDQALPLFEQAAALAGSVRNNWLSGVVRSEIAVILAMRADPARAASLFIEVLDHFTGPGVVSYEWKTLRQVVPLLVRLGADRESALLNRALVDVGCAPAFSTDQAAGSEDAPAPALSGPQAVELARTALLRFV